MRSLILILFLGIISSAQIFPGQELAGLLASAETLYISGDLSHLHGPLPPGRALTLQETSLERRAPPPDLTPLAILGGRVLLISLGPWGVSPFVRVDETELVLQIQEYFLTLWSEAPEPLCLNQARLEDLLSLPGLGPTLANRILENQPYDHLEDLLDLPGIGPARLEALRPYLTLQPTQGQQVLHGP